MTADKITKALEELDRECGEGIDDPVWTFERTARLVRDALALREEESREFRDAALLLNSLKVPLVKDGKHLALIDRIKELVRMVNEKRDSEK